MRERLQVITISLWTLAIYGLILNGVGDAMREFIIAGIAVFAIASMTVLIFMRRPQ